MKKLNNTGFTLIELILAIALSLIVMVPAFTFLVNSIQSARLEHNRIEVTKIVRKTLNGISETVREKSPEDISVVQNYHNNEVALRLGTDFLFKNGSNLVYGDINDPSSIVVYQSNIQGFDVTTIEGSDLEPKAISIEIDVYNDNGIEKNIETTVYVRGR